MPDRDGSIVGRSFGPYELLEKVGVGGMGSVYKAKLPGSNELVALKIANRGVAENPVQAQRFHNEFTIASQLQHPNLVRALGHGIQNSTPYLVMEFVPGQSLDKKLRDEGPMPLPEALAIFGQVACVLGFIHQNHLVHRDIKPGNILIDPCGTAKLADLGLAKDLDSTALLTNSGIGLGTYAYAAPEQFDDAKHVDFRCDIYGMAASLYVAMTGKYPFGPGSQMRVLMHKLEHQFTPLADLIDGVSVALDQVIIRSLHPDPAMRPASLDEFLAGMWSTQAPTKLLQPKLLPKLAGAIQVRPKPVEHAKVDVPAPSVANAVEERRGGTRHPIQLATTLGVLNASNQDSWPVQIMDISPGGMCLQIPRRFEANTVLNVFLPEEKTGELTPHLVRTCWTKTLPDKTWLIGCLFLTPLENEDLDQVLLSELCKTHMMRKVKRN